MRESDQYSPEATPHLFSNREYFKIFHGEHASYNQILRENPHLEYTVEKLLDSGKVIGQRTFLNGEGEIEEDTLFIATDIGGEHGE